MGPVVLSGARCYVRAWKAPLRTSLKEMMAAPSSTSRRDVGGMDPGVMPPTSAWWPLLATKNTICAAGLATSAQPGLQPRERHQTARKNLPLSVNIRKHKCSCAVAWEFWAAVAILG